MSATCQQCRAPIIWAFTENKAKIALDPTRLPDDEGKFAVRRDVHGVWQARVPTDDNRRDPWEHMHDPHVATCPAAKPPPDNVIPINRRQHARSR